nr:MAG TPA: hypothetical protein [Caudoviricetes sp.]
MYSCYAYSIRPRQAILYHCNSCLTMAVIFIPKNRRYIYGEG